MELKGRLHSITQDIKTGGYLYTFSSQDIPPGLETIPEGDLSIVFVPFKSRRSIQANAYHWSLVGKIARLLGRSNNAVHNMLLRDYGTMEELDGHPVYVPIVDTYEAAAQIEESAEYHLKPTSYVYMQSDGYIYRDYQMIRGSKYYNTEEMSRLIDGTIAEAKELGIETMSPVEIERMMKAYEEHRAKQLG